MVPRAGSRRLGGFLHLGHDAQTCNQVLYCRPSAALCDIKQLGAGLGIPDHFPDLGGQPAQHISRLALLVREILVSRLLDQCLSLEAIAPEQLTTAFHAPHVLIKPVAIASRIPDQEVVGVHALRPASLAGRLSNLVGHAPAAAIVLLCQIVARISVQPDINRMLQKWALVSIGIEQLGLGASTLPQLGNLLTDLAACGQINEPQFMGVGVPAVGAMGDLERSDQAPVPDTALQPAPSSGLPQLPEGQRLAFQQLGQAIESRVREGERHHDRLQVLRLSPDHGLLDLQAAPLLNLRRTDRAGPYAAAGNEAAVVRRLVGRGVVDLDIPVRDMPAVDCAENVPRQHSGIQQAGKLGEDRPSLRLGSVSGGSGSLMGPGADRGFRSYTKRP